MLRLGVWMVRLLPNELRCVFDDLIVTIQESKDYQEYLEFAYKMKKNNEIQALIREIKQLQKDLVQLEVHYKDTEAVTLQYQQKLEELESFPLYQEFLVRQKNVNIVLQMVKGQIEESLEKTVDI